MSQAELERITNVGFVDRFSIVHAAFGIWMGALKVGFIPTLLYHILYEIVENFVIKRLEFYNRIFPNARPDLWQNVVGDTVAAMLGWGLGQWKVQEPGQRLVGSWLPFRNLPSPELGG